jgi:hypothetical protein
MENETDILVRVTAELKKHYSLRGVAQDLFPDFDVTPAQPQNITNDSSVEKINERLSSKASRD